MYHLLKHAYMSKYFTYNDVTNIATHSVNTVPEISVRRILNRLNGTYYKDLSEVCDFRNATVICSFTSITELHTNYPELFI